METQPIPSIASHPASIYSDPTQTYISHHSSDVKPLIVATTSSARSSGSLSRKPISHEAKVVVQDHTRTAQWQQDMQSWQQNGQNSPQELPDSQPPYGDSRSPPSTIPQSSTSRTKIENGHTYHPSPPSIPGNMSFAKKENIPQERKESSSVYSESMYSPTGSAPRSDRNGSVADPGAFSPLSYGPDRFADSPSQPQDKPLDVAQHLSVEQAHGSSDFTTTTDVSPPLHVGFNHEAQTGGALREPLALETAWDSTPVSTFDPTIPKKPPNKKSFDDSSSVQNTPDYAKADAFEYLSKQIDHAIASNQPSTARQGNAYTFDDSPSDQSPDQTHHQELNRAQASEVREQDGTVTAQSAVPSPVKLAFGWEWYTDVLGDSFFINFKQGIVRREAPPPEPIPAQDELGQLPRGWEKTNVGGRDLFINREFMKQTWKDPRLIQHFEEHPLPAGWFWDVDEQSRIYYIDHTNHSTTFNHPKGAPTISDPDRLGSLPLGWNIDTTPAGRKFFINNNSDEEQSWKDPRLSAYFRLHPLPSGWDWNVTENGRVYFIDHLSAQNTFEDPRAYFVVQKPLELPTGWGMSVDDDGEFSFYDSVARKIATLPPSPQDPSPEQIPFLEMPRKLATSPVPQNDVGSPVIVQPLKPPKQATRSHSVASKASVDSRGSSGSKISSNVGFRQSSASPAQSMTPGSLPPVNSPYQSNTSYAQPQLHQPYNIGSPTQSISSVQQSSMNCPPVPLQTTPYSSHVPSSTSQSPTLGRMTSNAEQRNIESPFHTLCCHCQQGIPYNYQYERCTFCDLNICVGCAQAGRHPRHSSARAVMEVRTYEPVFPGRWCAMCRTQGPMRLDCRTCQYSICETCFVSSKGKITHKHENACLSRYLNPSHPKSGINVAAIGRDGTVHGHCCSKETLSHCPRCLQPETTTVIICLDCPPTGQGYCPDCYEWLSGQEGGCDGHTLVNMSYQKLSREEFDQTGRDRVLCCTTCEQSFPCSAFPSSEASEVIRDHLEENPEHIEYCTFVTPGMLRDIWAKSFMSCLRKPVRPDDAPAQNQTVTFDCVRCRNGTKLKNLVSCVPCISDPEGIRVCRQCFPFIAPTHEHSATEFICESDKIVPHDMLKIGWSARQNQMGRLWYSYTDPYTGAKSIPTFNQGEALRGPYDPVPQPNSQVKWNSQSFQTESKQAFAEMNAGMKDLWSKMKQSSNQSRPMGQPPMRPQSQMYGAPPNLGQQQMQQPGIQQSYASAQPMVPQNYNQQQMPQPSMQQPYANSQPTMPQNYNQQYPTNTTQGYGGPPNVYGNAVQPNQTNMYGGQSQPQQSSYPPQQYGAPTTQNAGAKQVLTGGINDVKAGLTDLKNKISSNPSNRHSYAAPGPSGQSGQPGQAGGYGHPSSNNPYSGGQSTYAGIPQNNQYPQQAQMNQPTANTGGFGSMKTGMKDLWSKIPTGSGSQQQSSTRGTPDTYPPQTNSPYGGPYESQPPGHHRSVSSMPGVTQALPQTSPVQRPPQGPRSKSNKLMKGVAAGGGAAIAMKFGMKALKLGLSGGEDFGDDDDFGGDEDYSGEAADNGGYGGLGGDAYGGNPDAALAQEGMAARGEANSMALI